jgi:hypothetical protein
VLISVKVQMIGCIAGLTSEQVPGLS